MTQTTDELVTRLNRDAAVNGLIYNGGSSWPVTDREMLALAAEVRRARSCHADPVAALLARNCPRPAASPAGWLRPLPPPRYTDRAGRVISAQRWANLVRAVEGR